jgi:benzodiazapine receptor
MSILIQGDKMKINYKKLIIIIIITFAIGSLFSLFTNSNSAYNNLQKPSLTPPAVVFPIAWSILYLLMAISFYLIYESDFPNKKKAYILYFSQLVINSLWTLIAFGLNLRLISFLWIVILFITVVLMIIEFYKINKKAAYLQIPYLLWLIFAGYLSLNIFLLNR